MPNRDKGSALAAAIAERLLAIAAEASRNDSPALAVKLARLASETNPSRNTLTQLAGYVSAIGDADEVVRLYQRILDEHRVPMDAQIALALGLAEAERGNFRASLNYFWRVVALREDNEELWFYIGTCYAMLRQFAAANHVFGRNILLPLQNGHATSTALLRLPSSPADIRKVADDELPFRRSFSIGQDVVSDSRASEAEIVHLVCCDSRYFKLFARAVARSVAERSGVTGALHFHLINPEAEDHRDLQELRSTFALPISHSTERVEFGNCSGEQIKTYLSCARFLLLPELQTHYGKPILITDADQTVLRPLDRLLAQVRGRDVGLLLFTRAHYNLLALISASVCVANASDGSRRYFASVRDYIRERMTDPQAIAWHLDQAALAAIYLASTDVDFALLPPSTMVSKILKPEASHNEDALFWSATYSIEANARKLDADVYRAMAI